jgi:glucokinase
MADGTHSAVGLVGDIGGTNARFALVDLGPGKPELIAPRSYLCSDFASAEEAVAAYLAERPEAPRPSAAVLAVAGPILDGEIVFTNTDWRISEAGFSEAMRLRSTKLVNDYAALALAAPMLEASDTEVIGPDVAGRPDGTLAILGAGTGFGVSALVRGGGRETVMTTEGGHMSLAPADEVEVEILRVLGRRFGRVSVERVLSGPGLLNLYEALAVIEGREAVAATPGEVTRRAQEGDPVAAAAIDRFCAVLGGVAGDFALAYGARGGVYLAGGVSRHLMQTLRNGGFRRRFEEKGRFEPYMREIPTRAILHPHTIALLGAARALSRS